ncbi:MAG: carboxypeptidase regulatory-like domain-containing protein [Candidatus Brocadia sp.]|nr:carboxypeptidase regulatory-like domain-containing protein [Candidatus Brocadia sp.]
MEKIFAVRLFLFSGGQRSSGCSQNMKFLKGGTDKLRLSVLNLYNVFMNHSRYKKTNWQERKINMLKNIVVHALCLMIALGYVFDRVDAQTTTSSVSGTVTNIARNPISGARVSLTCTKPKYSGSHVTGSNGTCEFLNLQPAGKYFMTVKKEGYRKIRTHLELTTGENKILNIKLAKKSTNMNETPVVNAGPDQAITFPDTVTLNGSVTDDGLPEGSTLTITWSNGYGPGTVTFKDPHNAVTTASFSNPGVYELCLSASDSELTKHDHVNITVESNHAYAPSCDILANPETIVQGNSATLTWTSTNATSAEIDQGIGAVAVNGSRSVSPAQSTTYTITVTGDGGSATASVTVTVNTDTTLPPDPVTVAPELDLTIATTLGSATAFLYTGDNPIQTGVGTDTIQAYRCAVLRGKVLNRENQPLSGVTITILNHPEFGQTLSRADGMFDMAVNGGGLLTVKYDKDGYLPAQRQVNAPWEDYAWLPDVVMIPADPQVTAIDLSTSTEMQMAQGSTINDEDGTRTASILFPQGTTAEMTLTDGSTQPLTILHIRATEYTVGANGPKAMPGELPPSSGYTYCVDLTADEAMAAGATSVHFSQPVPFYVENFVGFPVGSLVPTGFYDRSKGQWVASDNGRVVKIIDITGGVANLDTNGDGITDNGIGTANDGGDMGITSEERTRVVSLYTAGQSLWRVLLPHLTPWDHNWPYGPSAGSEPPGDDVGPESDNPIDDPNTNCGSIIGCEPQTLGEVINVTGTPLSLHYQSDRVFGRHDVNRLKIRLSGATLPQDLQSIHLRITIAGQVFEKVFPPQANLVDTFTWDGKDAYGRPVKGLQLVNVGIGYVYIAQYYATADSFEASFNRFGVSRNAGVRGGGGGGGVAVNDYIDFSQLPARTTTPPIILWKNYEESLGSLDSLGLGGWNLSVHHIYDVAGRTLYLGNGDKHSGATAMWSRGITTVAGNGSPGFGGDGGLATQARLYYPTGVAVGPDGRLYIADTSNNRIRRVGPDGIITTVAGTGIPGFSGDGGLATQAQISGAYGVAVGSDGSLYIADHGNSRIRRVGPDGIITTVAGNGTSGFGGDGGLATQARLSYPSGVAVGFDGSLYISDSGNLRIRQIRPYLPGYSISDFFIAAEDGSELYVFANTGRHLRTLDALTGAVRFQFTYDSANRLTTIADGDGNVTTIERDGSGNPSAIVAPFGQRTTLEVNGDGYLSRVTNPAGEAVQLTYNSGDAEGLLATLTDPRGNVHRYTYDTLGRLIRDENPAGGEKTLARTDIADGHYSVTLTTALGQANTYEVEELSTGDMQRVSIDPSGARTETLIRTNGSSTVTYPDGMVANLVAGPDPRFGMQAPVIVSRRTTTGGLELTITGSRTATLANSADPLSLQTLTQATSINGRTYTSVYNAASRTFTYTTPLGRRITTTIDATGRPVQWQLTGILPVNLVYDSRGRPASATVGSGGDERTATFGYNARGYLASATDPLNRTVNFEYNEAGRMTRQTLPDSRVINYTYDANGNITSVSPPGRPDHTFTYTPVDLVSDYTPPDIGLANHQTQYTYNLDKQLTRVTRPDGETIDLDYTDGGSCNCGRLSSMTFARGTVDYAYDAATGKLTTITALGGITLSYDFDGSLLTGETLTGAVTGMVNRTSIIPSVSPPWA